MEQILDTIRDITFVLIALETFAVLALLILLIRHLLRLVRILRAGVAPSLEDAQLAARTTRATAEFVGEHVVKPTAEARGRLSGFRRAMQVLFGDLLPPH